MGKTIVAKKSYPTTCGCTVGDWEINDGQCVKCNKCGSTEFGIVPVINRKARRRAAAKAKNKRPIRKVRKSG